MHDHTKHKIFTWSGLSGWAIPSTERGTEGAGLLLLSMSSVASFSSRLRFLLRVRKQASSIASKQTPAPDVVVTYIWVHEDTRRMTGRFTVVRKWE